MAQLLLQVTVDCDDDVADIVADQICDAAADAATEFGATTTTTAMAVTPAGGTSDVAAATQVERLTVERTRVLTGS